MSYSLSDKEFQSLLKGIQSTGYSAAIPESTPAPKEQGIFGDFVDSVQKGAYEGLGNLAAGVNALTGGGNRFLGEVSAWAGKKADEQLDTMSGEMKKALSQSAFDGFDDETGEAQGVLNLHWWAGNFGAFLGQNLDTVATLGVGKIATTGVKMAGKALTKESAEQIGEAAIKEAAKRGIPAKYSNAIGYSAIMGAMAAGGRDNQVREELNAYSEEDLAQIEGFREEYFKLRKDEQFSDKDDRFVFDLARENFTAKAGRSAALNPTALATDLAAGLVGGLGGGLGGIFAAGKTVKGGLLKGAAIEAATEGVQGAVEQRAINETARQYYDAERDLNEGVGEAVAEGMVLGGAFGGVFGGVDSGLNNRAIGKQKRRILEAINTGDEEIDARLKAHSEMANQFANDLDDLVSVQQRIHSMNQRAQEVVQQQAVEEQARLAEEEAQRAKAEAFADTPEGMFAKFKQDGLTDVEIDQYLTAQVSAKTKHLDELRAKPFQMSDDYEASLVAKQQYHADLANTEAELARWQSLVDYHKQGKSSAPSEQAVEMPLNFANTETAAPPESSEANRYSFAGVNARTANHSLLEQAKSAIVEGKDPEAVRQETGWFTGKDGKWRFEIDDSQVQLKTPYADGEIGYAIDPDFEGRTVALSELIDAPQLFAAYPDLAGLQVNTQTAGSSFYSPEKDIISLNGSRTGDSAKSSLLHEIQHAIQARENFAKGSNPGKFKEMTEAELSEKPLITLLKNASQSSREAYHQFRNAEIKLQNYPDNQEIRKAYDRAEQHLLNQADGEQILTAYWSIDGGQALVSPEEQYMRSAGEVEARNVQTRMGMTAEERQMTSPLSTEDRPYHQQTVSFDYEPSYELDENANSGFARAVDSVFSSTEKVHPTRWIELGTTPQALIQSGISDKKMLLSNSKLVKIKHDHPEMTADLLKQIPRELNNPVAVFKNTKAGSPHNSYVVLTELQAENGESVIVALHADKTDRGLEFNKLASIYGRNESRTYIKNMVEKSDVRFVDTQKAGRISRELQLLSGDTLNLLFDGASVVKTEEGVKYQDKEIRKLLRVKLGNRAAQQIELVSRRNPPQGANIESLITQGVEGWFNPKTGNITLIEESIQATSTMSREARLTWVAWHELAHRGVKVQFQGRYSAIMQKADKNSVVKAIADRIQAERQGANDLAATNRDVAVEEAIAELYSAFETGNYEELRQRYGAKITNLHENNFRAWFDNLAVQLREFFAKLLGKERSDTFSNQQLLGLLKEVRKGIAQEDFSAADTRHSVSESEVNKQFMATAQAYGGEAAYSQAKAEGKTELDYRQWVQVRTPAFKEWFGDWEANPDEASKIINPRTGEPLVVYHGTPKSRKFNIFKTNSGTIWVSSNRHYSDSAYAGDKGRVYDLFANIKNPIFVGDISSSVTSSSISRLSENSDIHISELENIANKIQAKEIWEITQSQEFVKILKDKGGDGINAIEARFNTFAGFNPNQIKSPTDNNGDFSAETDDIRFSRRARADFAEKAKPKRTASSFDEARAIVTEFLGEPLTNKATGMVATISKRSLDKLVSGKAHTKSTSLEDHLMAVANIDSLFENAVQGWVEPHKSDTVNIAGMHKMFAPLLIDNEMKLAKITVKKMNFNQGNKIYSVETIEVENGTVPEMTEVLTGNSNIAPHRLHGTDMQSLIQRIADFNSRNENFDDDIRYSRRPKSESLAKLRQAKPIHISGTEIEVSDDLKQYRRNVMEYGKGLRGSYINKDTGQEIDLSRASITEVLHHDLSKPEHLQSIAAIPQIIENATYISTLPNEDVAKNPTVREYEYYVAGLNIGGIDYTVKAAVGVGKDGSRYYDHKLTQIEKGKLLSLLDRLSNAGASEANSPLSAVNDKRLLQILQADNSAARYSRSVAMDKLGLGKEQSVFEQASQIARQAKEKPVSEWKAWATALGKRANAAIFDALAPLKYAEDEAGIADHTKSAYTAARLAAGSASITEAAMLHGLPEFDKDGFVQRKHGTGSKESLVGIMEGLGSDVNDFLGWVEGNRAEQLMREGRENNLNSADVAYLKGLNRGKEAKFEAARKQLQAWNTAILDLAERSGLLSPAERAKFGNNEFYIPFYREDDDGDPIAPYRKSGLANQNSGIRKLKGSDKATSDLLSNLISNASKVIDASVKNMAMTKAVTNLVDTQVISEISTPTMMDYRQLNNRNGNKLMVKLNGEERMFEVHDQGLFNALTNIDQKPMDYPMRKIFSGAKRLLTATVTSMPDFMVRNFLRDIVQAATTDRNNMKLGIDSLKGLKSAYAKDGVAVDLMFTGATFGAGNIDAGDPTRAAAKIRKHLRKKGYSAAEVEGYMQSVIWSKDKFEQVLDKYFEVGSAVENANRIAVYQSALAAGKSKAQAALEAKDLMDFSMHGNAYLIRLLGDVLPFFNARLQGLSQLGRALKDNPRKVALRGMTMAAVSVALAIMNADNPAYEELPEEEKDNYWHLFVGSEHFRIPKPFEIGVIFGTIPERLFRTTAGYDKTGLFADRVVSAISNTFAFNPMPQLLKPVYEVYSNQNMFTGRAIETMSDQRVRPEDRYDHNTSLVARGLGSLTGTSPKQIEHLVRGYFGTLGMYVLGMTDSAIRTGGNYGVQPHKYWNEYPVLSAVFGGDVNVPPRYTSYMNDFYEYLNEANQIAATVKSYEDDGRKQDALMLKREHAQLLAQRPKLSGVSQEIRQAKARMEMIMASNELSAEQKRTRIDELLRKRNGLVKSVVERMREEDF